MTKNTIVQFVCFQTDIELDSFIPSWEEYAGSLGKDIDVSLHQQHNKKSRFKYVSRHTSLRDDFHFVFVKGRKPEHFNDVSVRVVQAGGYTPIQIERAQDATEKETKVLVFVNSNDISEYRQVKPYRHLNIYEAYFESSSYAYILEFFVQDADADRLVQQIKDLGHADEMGIYKECVRQEA